MFVCNFRIWKMDNDILQIYLSAHVLSASSCSQWFIDPINIFNCFSASFCRQRPPAAFLSCTLHFMSPMIHWPWSVTSVCGATKREVTRRSLCTWSDAGCLPDHFPNGDFSFQDVAATASELLCTHTHTHWLTKHCNSRGPNVRKDEMEVIFSR